MVSLLGFWGVLIVVGAVERRDNEVEELELWPAEIRKSNPKL